MSKIFIKNKIFKEKNKKILEEKIIFFQKGARGWGQELFGKSPNILKLLKFLYILRCFRLKTYVVAPA